MTELPTTFGKYFLTEKIATGGMAEIYLAKLIGPGGFEKQLIIKQIHPELSGQPQFVNLFVAEAKTLVSLTHGNIVPVYELGVFDDTYFIAMEYIDGPTLGALNEAIWDLDQVLEPPLAAYICAELLKGLSYAHRKGEGVIHRDLSPRNVMISREGEVKLVDFGIAITLEKEADDDLTLTESDGTRPEGSYPYMSPEQVRRGPLTGQSDLFSAGVLLWEMLVGRHLFVRPTAEETLTAVLKAPIEPPSQLRPGVPDELDEICLRALSRERDERWQTAGEFLTAINRYLYSLETHVTPAQISVMVAGYCPPMARRAGSEGDATPAPELDPGDLLDQTRPLARPARGKRQGTATSTQTFATNVQFEHVLAKATPLVPLSAITDEMIEQVRASAEAGRDHADAGEREPGETEAIPRQGRPLRASLLVASGAALGAAGLAIYLLTRSAGAPAPAAIADASPAPIDGGTADGGSADATAAIADAGEPDARRIRHRPDAAVVGTATLKVGANPWGEVYLDGKKLGRAPGAWQIPAGRHDVEVRFPVAGQEQSRHFPVVLGPDQVQSLGVVDFTKQD